jgi:hypothetical protein
MEYKHVSAALAVLCLVLAGLIASGAVSREVYVNKTVYPQDDLRVYYLYPLRCIDCDLNKPGQCDFCNSYYDERMMDTLSQSVGVPVKYYVSDAVNRPNVFVASKDKVILGDGRGRFNIAHTLCSFAKVEPSCELFSQELVRVGSCVAGYGLGKGDVVYHTNSKNCAECQKTEPIVAELKGLDFEGAKINVRSVDSTDAAQMKLMQECLQGFDNTDYAPQLLCPKTGKDLTGVFTLSQARDFAEECLRA